MGTNFSIPVRARARATTSVIEMGGKGSSIRRNCSATSDRHHELAIVCWPNADIWPASKPFTTADGILGATIILQRLIPDCL
jgi:hypothetical protein